jgi:hypothetical protein
VLSSCNCIVCLLMAPLSKSLDDFTSGCASH